MAVLITGVQGFVGARLVALLKKQGREVVLFEGDITDRATTLDWTSDKKIDAVVHLAAVVSVRRQQLFQQVNVAGTTNIIALARKLSVGRLIFMSSLRVLSAGKGDPYINSKREAEQLVIKSELPYIILRPSIIYGPGDNKNIGFLLRAIKKLPVVPVFNFKMQPIFIDDVVAAIAASLDIPAGQTINMAGSETVTYLDLLEALKSRGYKIRLFNAPRLFNFLLTFFSYLPFSPMPHWQVKTLLTDEIFEEYEWLELFKLKPISLAEGLARMA